MDEEMLKIKMGLIDKTPAKWISECAPLPIKAIEKIA